MEFLFPLFSSPITLTLPLLSPQPSNFSILLFLSLCLHHKEASLCLSTIYATQNSCIRDRSPFCISHCSSILHQPRMSQEIELFLEIFSKAIEEDKASQMPFKDKLEKIRDDLHGIRSKIPDELPPGITNTMRGLLYELHDVLQECLEQQKGKQSFSDIICSPIKPNTMQNKLEKLEKELADMAKEIGKLPPSGSDGQQAAKAAADGERDERPYEWTTSFIDETKIYGWDDYVKEIVDPLIDNNDFSAVGIVGMYGSGKTALAQKIFIDERIQENFPVRIWVCVSPSCTPKELIFRLLDNLGLEEEQVHRIVQTTDKEKIDVGELLFILHVQLLDMRYLIVFDDIWDTDEWHRNLTAKPPLDKEWKDRLAFGLPKGHGSAVIVTSRLEEDARMMVETGKIYHPPPLGVEDGWKLFTRAYKEVNTKEDNELTSLEEMKEYIVNKCRGYPMALIAAGRGLAREEEPRKEEPRD